MSTETEAPAPEAAVFSAFEANLTPIIGAEDALLLWRLCSDGKIPPGSRVAVHHLATEANRFRLQLEALRTGRGRVIRMRKVPAQAPSGPLAEAVAAAAAEGAQRPETAVVLGDPPFQMILLSGWNMHQVECLRDFFLTGHDWPPGDKILIVDVRGDRKVELLIEEVEMPEEKPGLMLKA
jgi:hypothetical protein